MRTILPILFMLLVITVVGLFLLKKDSTYGRLLIWKVTTLMIKDNDILIGSGNGAFQTKYMLYQANYFKSNPDSTYSQLADNVLHPFNEFLQLTVEYGIIGLLLFLNIYFIIARYFKLLFSSYLLCLFSILIFALFSYPYRYPFVWLISAYSLGQLSQKMPIIYSFSSKCKKHISICLIGVFLVCSLFLIREIQFEYKWKRIVNISILGKVEESHPQYKKLSQHWNKNPLFLYNYGAELNFTKEYTRSIHILLKCEKYFNDYDVQMLLADNYFNLENWELSELHYKTASNMCPNRFIPLEKLMLIYQNTNRQYEANKMAEYILIKPIKVHSHTIDKIKGEALKQTGFIPMKNTP